METIKRLFHVLIGGVLIVLSTHLLVTYIIYLKHL
jgi:hypothetical protein